MRESISEFVTVIALVLNIWVTPNYSSFYTNNFLFEQIIIILRIIMIIMIIMILRRVKMLRITTMLKRMMIISISSIWRKWQIWSFLHFCLLRNPQYDWHVKALNFINFDVDNVIFTNLTSPVLNLTLIMLF